MDLQLELSRALQARDLVTFERVLKLDADANKPDDHNGVTIYEKALATAGCGEFIRLCLQYGCSPNYINKKNKAAVNFASDSRDSGNLKALFDQATSVQVNNKYNGLTPINSLAKNLNHENVSEVTECIRLLLEKGASPNIADDREMRPLNYVISSKINPEEKQVLVDLFLQQPDIYLDDELRDDLKAWNPQLTLPEAPRTTNPSVELVRQQLLEAIRNRNMEKFCSLLGSYEGHCSDLYKECITHGYSLFLDYLLQQRPTADRKDLVDRAIAHGNWYALDKLLEGWQMPKDIELLNATICRLDEKSQQSFSDFGKCFDLLLATGRLNLNVQDKIGRTPLHYATLYNHEYAVQQLLRYGASLNIGSNFTELAIESIEPALLEEHFDDCISSNDQSRASKDFEVTLNYKTFRLPGDLDGSEMKAIRAIGESKTHRHLLNHPLITSLIMSLKWQSISTQIYIEFAVTALLNMLISVNILLTYTERIPTIKTYIIQPLSWISIGCLAIFEIMCLLLLPKRYPVSRVMNVSLVVLATFSNILGDPGEYHTRIIAAFTIVLVAVRLTALIGSLPNSFLSLYTLMLREVGFTFLKSCLPYSVLVIGFGLSFYLLNVHSLSKLSMVDAVIKTIVMSTGEFDEGEIDYKQLFFARVFFIVFVLFISIVLMNLLSALAFSDIQAIQAAAEVRRLNSLVDLLMFYDMCLDKCKPLRNFLNSTKIPEVVFTYPNKKQFATVMAPTSRVEMEPLIKGSAGSDHKINITTDRCVINLNKSTIKRIHKLLEKKSRRNNKNFEMTDNKIASIESMLRQLMANVH